MKQTRTDIMGMPITVEIVDETVTKQLFDEVFGYFTAVDERFSRYKENSEISRTNRGEVKPTTYSAEMREVLRLSEQTKHDTHGYFDIDYKGKKDPSGLVKGWAIQNVADLLKKRGFNNFYIEAGGDIHVSGKNSEGNPWRVGIRNPFNRMENVKVVILENQAIATAGTYIRGLHIYNPHALEKEVTEIVSLTVIGSTIYDADRFSTVAFAMGKAGIEFINSLKNFQGYMIDKDGMATYTKGFEKYVL